MARQSANAFKTSSVVRGSACIMVSGDKKSGKTFEDVFKSGMDDMILAREELAAAESKAEAEKLVESTQTATPDPLVTPASTGPPMPAAVTAGPPMPEAGPEPEPAPDPLLTTLTPAGPPMDSGAMPPMGPGTMPPGAMPPMGPGAMPPMGPGAMPPVEPSLAPPSGPPSEILEQDSPAEIPTEAPNMSVDSSAMPPMSGLGPMPVPEPTITEPVVAEPVVAEPVVAEPVIEVPPQVAEQPKPKVKDFGDWESHFDNEWEGGAAVFEGENAPPVPEEKFDEVSWDPGAKAVRTIPKLPAKSVMNKMKKAELSKLAEGRGVSSDGTKNQIIDRLLGTPEDDVPEELETPETPSVDEPELAVPEPELTVAEPELTVAEEEATVDDTDSTLAEEAPVEALPAENFDLLNLAGSLMDETDSTPPVEPSAEPATEEPSPMPPAGPPSGPGPMPPAGPPSGPGPMPPAGPPSGPGPMPPAGPPSGPGPMPPAGPPSGPGPMPPAGPPSGPGPMPPSGPPTDE